MVRKAIFGGTFDPIHNGHLHIAYEALYKLNLDEVIFMPNGNSPHKENFYITEAYLRYEMAQMAIKSEPQFRVSDYEIISNEVCYTYKTMQYFKKVEPETQWYFLTGADCLVDLPNWKNIDKIFEASSFTVFLRPGYSITELQSAKQEIEKKYSTKILLLDVPMLDISSTNIRTLIGQHKNVSFLMPESVYNFVSELKLYS
jgi:nicotinate-nucleotide adenylyltransferase